MSSSTAGFGAADNCEMAARASSINAMGANNLTRTLLDFSLQHDAIRLFCYNFKSKAFVEP